MTNAEYILATRLTLLQNDKLEKDTDSCEAHEAFHELCTATARCRFTPAAILARANTCDVTNETVVTFFYTCQSGTATTYTECFNRVQTIFNVWFSSGDLLRVIFQTSETPLYGRLCFYSC